MKSNGFNIPLAIEKDLWASETYKANHSNTKIVTEDITKIENPKDLLDANIIIDGIIGGPPCQGFSLSGNRDVNDPRNSLFMEFVRFVKIFQPKFFVMENVTGILSMKTKNKELVKDIILEEYNKIGYNVEIFKLNAAEYGVPQSRIRIFFIGIRKDLKFYAENLAPKPFLFGEDQISIKDAIMDLPQILSGQGQEITDYTNEPITEYQKWARKNSLQLTNHVAMRHTQRLIERFKNIGYGESVAHVSDEHKQRKRGDANTISNKVYSQNNMRPYPEKPSPTVPASFQSNFIHPYLNRNYTAREGARLQSFPDTYHFCGKRTTMSWEKNLSQYQQIGNAVPPLLAKAIASNIKNYFKNI
ncbi:MAG: DNA cytosine methyltransferase [Clostridia bacterium]|nr:DNA cytosine methyltransferase [Clostridia bacterium]MDD4387590.1 DNA cytosine methyltransferase [Clostridia bacterium]